MRYDEELEEDEDDDPNDPRHRDYDLSEAGISVHEDYDEKPWFLRRGVILVIAVLVLIGLFLPVLNIISGAL